MGIRGLTSWLHGCASAFTKTISLEKCDLVLDAIGVAFDLLADAQEQLAAELRQSAPCNCQEPCSCVDMVVQAMTDTGAIWPYFVESATLYLQQLQQCVGPQGRVLAVMDGSTPLSKVNTWAARARASHAAARKLSVELSFGSGSCVSAWQRARLERRVQGRSRAVHMRPGLLPAALACACAAAGVQLMQAQGEADDTIMELLTAPLPAGAAARRAVVVSNDSDFMAAPTTAHGGLGMVYPAELKACVVTHLRTQEPCRVLAFRHDRMVRVMQLPSAAAPLLGACLGNDAYDPSPATCHALLLASSQTASKGQRMQGFAGCVSDPSPPSVDAACALLRRCVLAASQTQPAAAAAAVEDASVESNRIARALIVAVGKAMLRVPCSDCAQAAGRSGANGGKTKHKKRNFQRGGQRKTASAPLDWMAVPHTFVAQVQPVRAREEGRGPPQGPPVSCPVVASAVSHARETLASIKGLQHLCVCNRQHLLDFSTAAQLALLSGSGSALLRTVHPFPSRQPQEALHKVTSALAVPTLMLDSSGQCGVFAAADMATAAVPSPVGSSAETSGQLALLAKGLCKEEGLACSKVLEVAEAVGHAQLVAQSEVGVAHLQALLAQPLRALIEDLSCVTES